MVTISLTILTIIGLACMGFLFAEAAEPIQNIKEIFNLHTEAICKNKVQWFFVKMLNCSLCFSFWLGLIVTLNLYYAAIISILAETISRQFNKN